MATITVINANVPPTCGNSIIIDQDQVAQQQQPPAVNCHQQPQSQCLPRTLRSQKADNGQITIYHNIAPTTPTTPTTTVQTTTTQMTSTPSTAVTRTVFSMSTLQPRQNRLVTTTKATKATKATTSRIDVNRNNNSVPNESNDDEHNDELNIDDLVADHIVVLNDRPNDEFVERHLLGNKSEGFVNDQETSYSNIKKTITINTAPTPTFPHLLLKVAGERGTTNNTDQIKVNNQRSVVEIDEIAARKADSFVAVEVGKSQENKHILAIPSVANVNGQIEQTLAETSSINSSTSATKTTINGHNQLGLMIIQCNIADDQHASNEERDDFAYDGYSNNDGRYAHDRVAEVASASNVYHDESRVTSIGGNGQNAFERICVNGQNGSERDRHASGSGFYNADNQQQLESADVNANANPIVANSLNAATTTKTDCASTLTETVVRRCSADDTNTTPESEPKTHVVKIQIKSKKVCEHNEKQVTVVTLNETQTQIEQQTTQEKELPYKSPVSTIETIEQRSARPRATGESANELHLNGERMVQKPTAAMSLTATAPAAILTPTTVLNSAAVTVSGGNSNTNANVVRNVNGHVGNTITSGNTTVTELNVSQPSYLYYVMSSGQFSPCDTLDSGTGSDLESNCNITPGTPSPQSKLHSTLEKLNAATQSTQNGGNCASPNVDMHLKTTKVRLNGGATKSVLDSSNSSVKSLTSGEHTRAGSLTDSEESESSSLSCDSLHSTEFIRRSSVSPTTQKSSCNVVAAARVKMLGAFLPDSLLRDIRDRKFPTNDFEMKYGDGGSADGGVGGNDTDADADGDAITITSSHDAINEQDYINIEHSKFLQERNSNNNNKRASLPNKTFVLNTENGTFVDTKMNSMPRKYEADKFYNFHVKEHEHFCGFDIGGGDSQSLSEYGTRSVHDDAFAGYKDLRCASATSTIRSSKGTVRGVKNRVRNGIATFLQLQQPNVKNFKEKDAGKVVLYTTSMGIIRDTYAKCANMKQILRTLLVKFEERDVFMSIEYQQEIKQRMHLQAIKVPQLFVEGQHIGDADTVERLNESGELRQLLKPYKSIATTFTCQTCGGYRLLPCPSCNGSKKSVHRNHFTAEFVALKCMNCDEVGLVKCHNC